MCCLSVAVQYQPVFYVKVIYTSEHLSGTASNGRPKELAVRSPRNKQVGPKYGYVIMALAFLTQLFSTGLVFYAFGVFLGPISDFYGWGKAETAFGFSLFNLSTIFYNPLLGRGIERYGPRRFLLYGCLFTSGGLLLLTQITALWQFYGLMLIVVGFGGTAMGTLSSHSALANWFVRRRAFAIAVSSAGVSLGGVVVIFFGSLLIERYSWQLSMQVLAISIALIVFYPVFRWMINRPEDVGMAPDGEPALEGLVENVDSDGSLQMLASWSFWRFAICFALALLGLTGVLLFLKRSVEDFGFSAWEATRTFGLTALVGVVVKPILGRIGDSVSKRLLIGLAIVLQTAAVVLILCWRTNPGLYLFSILFGSGMSAMLPIFSAWVAEYYGRQRFARAMSLIIPCGVIIQSVGFYAGGLLFDRYRDWQPTFAMLLCVYLVALASVFYLPTQRASPALNR